MSDRLFDKPVYVTKGRYLTLEIASIHDALMFLHEWPEDDRDLIYETAWKACCDAHDGVKPIIAAQKTRLRALHENAVYLINLQFPFLGWTQKRPLTRSYPHN